jgi:hypothetical protein
MRASCVGKMCWTLAISEEQVFAAGSKSDIMTLLFR